MIESKLPTPAERNKALDYFLSLKLEGKPIMQYYAGDITKEIPVSLETIAGLAASYHRDNSPIVQERTGRKFKEG